MIDIVTCTEKPFSLGFKKIIYTKQFNVVEGISEQINRKAVENKQVDILLAPEKAATKDFMHQRGSGLNQVLCKLAHKNGVAIGFSFAELLHAKNKAKILGRMMQNVRLCKKYKVKMVLASFAKNKWEMRSAEDLLSLARVLGMPPKEAKASLNFQKKRKAIKAIR